jgi:hypothetical protein
MWFDNFDVFNKEKSGLVDCSNACAKKNMYIHVFTMPISNFQEILMGYHFSNLCFKFSKANGQLISKGHFCVFKSNKKPTKFLDSGKAEILKKIVAFW